MYKDIEQYTMIYDTACKGLAVGEPDEAGETGQFCVQLCMKPHSCLSRFNYHLFFLSRFNEDWYHHIYFFTGEGRGGGPKELPEHEQHPRLEPFCDQTVWPIKKR